MGHLSGDHFVDNPVKPCSLIHAAGHRHPITFVILSRSDQLHEFYFSIILHGDLEFFGPTQHKQYDFLPFF